MFRTIEEEVMKKQMEEILKAQLEQEDSLAKYISCPFPEKNFGQNMVMKECGIVRLNSDVEYCSPQRVEECKLLYGLERRRT